MLRRREQSFSLDGKLVPVSLGAIKVLALVDGAELEETQSGAALGAVAAQALCPRLRFDGDCRRDLCEGCGGEGDGGGL